MKQSLEKIVTNKHMMLNNKFRAAHSKYLCTNTTVIPVPGKVDMDIYIIELECTGS